MHIKTYQHYPSAPISFIPRSVKNSPTSGPLGRVASNPGTDPDRTDPFSRSRGRVRHTSSLKRPQTNPQTLACEFPVAGRPPLGATPPLGPSKVPSPPLRTPARLGRRKIIRRLRSRAPRGASSWFQGAGAQRCGKVPMRVWRRVRLGEGNIMEERRGLGEKS